MNPIDTTAPSQTDAISFELDLEHPPEKVWRALTDPALLAEWLLPVVDLKLEPGAAFASKTQAYPGWERHRELPIHRDRSRAQAQLHVDRPFLDTVVTFTLAPTASGTRPSLVQSGFKPDQQKESGGSRYGWKMMGGKLVELLARIP